jgi:hypothetical protein
VQRVCHFFDKQRMALFFKGSPTSIYSFSRIFDLDFAPGCVWRIFHVTRSFLHYQGVVVAFVTSSTVNDDIFTYTNLLASTLGAATPNDRKLQTFQLDFPQRCYTIMLWYSSTHTLSFHFLPRLHLPPHTTLSSTANSRPKSSTPAR